MLSSSKEKQVLSTSEEKQVMFSSKEKQVLSPSKEKHGVASIKKENYMLPYLLIKKLIASISKNVCLRKTCVIYSTIIL